MTLVAAAAFGALLIGFGWLLSRDVPRVWRGERSRWLPLSGSLFDVTQRSYTVVVAAVVGFGAACLLLGLAGVMWEAEEIPRLIAVAALVLGGFFGIGGLLLAGVIEATNRPRFLVPPPLRNKPGSITAARQRRSRARRGEAATDHDVVLIAVEPRSGSEISPYWFAICDDCDCNWQSNTGDEASTRREARRHSSRTPRLERRPLEG